MSKTVVAPLDDPSYTSARDLIVPTKKDSKVYTAADMRASFMRGAGWSRQHVYNPIEMRPVKDAEEALANWPD
jgi:hypothetical protein